MKMKEIIDVVLETARDMHEAGAMSDETLKEFEDMKEYKLYVDMDGVLFDFVAGVSKLVPGYDDKKYEKDKEYRSRMWKAVKDDADNGGELWFNLPLMKDAMELWNYIKKYNPEILSATGTTDPSTGKQKKRSIAKHFGKGVKVNLVEKAEKKQKFAAPKHILIDDKTRATKPFEAAGGIGIVHTSAANTIKQLKKLGL